MVDFLRENTWCSPEQYKWHFSVAQIRLMSLDFTHIEYLDTEKNGGRSRVKKQNTISLNSLESISDLGFPIMHKK